MKELTFFELSTKFGANFEGRLLNRNNSHSFFHTLTYRH